MEEVTIDMRVTEQGLGADHDLYLLRSSPLQIFICQPLSAMEICGTYAEPAE